MQILRVGDDSLASVMVLDRRLEEYPEPYRGHDDITLVISFGEYVRFIDKYLEVTDYLATPSVLLKSKLALDDEDALLRAFYKDMACAIVKEVWYTHRGGVPTKIIHEIEGGQVFDYEFVQAYSGAFRVNLTQARLELLAIAERAGYEYQTGVLNKQQGVLDYASLLFAMSSADNAYGVGFTRWSMKGDSGG